jgi:transposase
MLLSVSIPTATSTSPSLPTPTVRRWASYRFRTRQGLRRVCSVGSPAIGPDRVVVSIEGTRRFGIGVARALSAAGLPVIECEQPARKTRRGRGKSDPIDAHLAVLTALQLDADRLPTPRADGTREALRILLGVRQELTTTTTAQTNRLRALLLSGPDRDRDISRARLTDTTLAALARRRLPTDATLERAVRHDEIRRLALALRHAAQTLTANRRQLQELVDSIAPGLTHRRGLGPVSAAQLIVSYSHPGRVRNEAAFAALAGTSPLPASSGRTVRHRLNRGGDRALNRAIHTIALTRLRSCPRKPVVINADPVNTCGWARCPRGRWWRNWAGRRR